MCLLAHMCKGFKGSVFVNQRTKSVCAKVQVTEVAEALLVLHIEEMLIW